MKCDDFNISREKNLIWDCFPSLDKMLNFCEEVDSRWSNEVSKQEGRDGWAGTKSWEDAVKLARYGWKEGRDKLMRAIELSFLKSSTSSVPAEAYDVGGAYPIVPVAVTGDPSCMVIKGLDNVRTRPTYNFLVNISASCYVEPEQIINRGAAILSYVDILEDKGMRCEINVFESCKGGSQNYLTSCPVKTASEPLEIDRAAFILINPSMLRRICFATLEKHAEYEGNFHSNYGIPSDFGKKHLTNDANVLYFPKMTSNDHFKTPEKSMKRVKELLEECNDRDTSEEDD